VTLPVSSNIPVTSLSTTNGVPTVSLSTTNGVPIVSLTTTNGLPLVTLSTVPFPGIGEATTATRVRASPSFSLISPSKVTLVTVTTRVATKAPPVVTVTVTRLPGVVIPEPTLVRGPPWRRPPVRGRPGRGPWGEDEE